MTAKIRVSPDLTLPEDVVTSTLVVYGGKGMGKTNFASVLVEELTKARLRWALLDPMGVAWGLRHSVDGKGPGVECVILGGPHGDIPIEPTGGAIVADLVIDESVNTIIDFSRKLNGQMWTVGEKIRFVTDYTLRLFQRQGELVGGRRREPLLQILDEAARYIPQTIPAGAVDLARCVGAWEQACEEGRNIGLGVAFITQRSARMNKSVSELADVMLAFRTVGPNSLRAVMDWLGDHVAKDRVRELAAQVRTLDVGQALVVSPGWLDVEKIARIRARETFDSSATPKAGQRQARVTGPAAKPDLAKYQARMAETIERAKADDPKELRREIAALRKQVGEPAATVTGQRTIDRAIAAAVKGKDAEIAALMREQGAIVSRVGRFLRSVEDDAGVLREFLISNNVGNTSGDSRAELQVGHREKSKTTGANHTPDKSTAVPRPGSSPRARAVAPPTSDLPSGERIVLTAIAQYPDGVDREQLTVLTGYKASSRNTYIQRLSARGFVAVGSMITATPAGLEALGDFEPLPTGNRLREHWLERLPEGERKVLSFLCDRHPDEVPREDLDHATGYKASSRNTYIQRLSARKLITLEGRGAVKANDTLFGR